MLYTPVLYEKRVHRKSKTPGLVAGALERLEAPSPLWPRPLPVSGYLLS